MFPGNKHDTETTSSIKPDKNNDGTNVNNSADHSDINENQVVHKSLSFSQNGMKQIVNILEYRPGRGSLVLKPVLSSDLVYGFEKLSSMAQRKKALAAVNGGFFSLYGLPSGMITINGEIYTSSEGKYPIFYISSDKAGFFTGKSRISLKIGGFTAKMGELNRPYRGGNAGIVYTKRYGLTNKTKESYFAVVVEKGLVKSYGLVSGSIDIPDEGFVACFFGKKPDNPFLENIIKDSRAEIIHYPVLTSDMQAYECGSCLLEKGRIVAGERDALVGTLNNYDPRTAVGIMSDGTVVLVVVDGRQPGYSIGMKGRQLAEFLLEYGVLDAAMLDGGASSEMIFKNRIINRPSFKGQERPLAGALVICEE